MRAAACATSSSRSTFEIHDEALPAIDIHSGRAVPISAEDEEPDVIRLTDHHELDLERPIREAILLAQPIAPLDREDCPGLCVVCGLPLDEGDHDHPDDDIDPRLEALRGFRARRATAAPTLAHERPHSGTLRHRPCQLRLGRPGASCGQPAASRRPN